MRKVLEILTPENVHVEYELAGLGSRFVAFFLDTVLQFLLIILVLVGMSIGQMDIQSINYLDPWIVAVGILLVFLIFFGYFIFFEMLTNGQSPGKKIMKLRVLKQNGEPVGFWESLLRNILRMADFLPALNLIGTILILFTDKYKRVGDFAANTIVVKAKKDEQPVGIEDLLKQAAGEDSQKVNLYPVNNDEYGVLKEFLMRKDKLGERRPVFAYHLNKYFMEKFNLTEPAYSDPFDFFEDIVRMNSGL